MLAVPAPAVRLAGLEEAVDSVGAASDLAFHFATAMFATEAFAVRSGVAARHGARLLLPLLPAAVCATMLGSWCCRGGASIDLAPSIRTMPSATAACNSTSLAALDLAHFDLAAAMPATQSSCFNIRFAIVKRADLFGAMLFAQPIFHST